MSAPIAIPLHEIFARRWAVPVLAEMHGEGGAKFVTLTNRLEAPRASVQSSLALLDTLGLVHRNPGHGHPMRPEYVLSERGRLIAEPSVPLMRAIHRVNAMDIALKRWSMPTLHAIARGYDRFRTITTHLSKPTDRAISLTITDLHKSSLILREVVDSRPPRPRYQLEKSSNRIAHILSEIESALSTP